MRLTGAFASLVALVPDGDWSLIFAGLTINIGLEGLVFGPCKSMWSAHSVEAAAHAYEAEHIRDLETDVFRRGAILLEHGRTTARLEHCSRDGDLRQIAV